MELQLVKMICLPGCAALHMEIARMDVGVAASTALLPMGDCVGGFIICLSAGAIWGRSLIYSMLYRWPARVGVKGHAVSPRV